MLKTKDIIRFLEEHGFAFIRGNKHLIYRKDAQTVAVPKGNVCSRGLCRRLFQQAGFDREVIRGLIG